MFASASAIRRDVSELLKPPARMPVAEAVEKFMRVPLPGRLSPSAPSQAWHTLTFLMAATVFCI